MSAGVGSKKGKKSKGLVLTALQETALLAITGALRFLTLLDVNKMRIQQVGAVPALVTLATQASRASLCYNAQSVLSKYCMPWLFATWHVWEPGLKSHLTGRPPKAGLKCTLKGRPSKAGLKCTLTGRCSKAGLKGTLKGSHNRQSPGKPLHA